MVDLNRVSGSELKTNIDHTKHVEQAALSKQAIDPAQSIDQIKKQQVQKQKDESLLARLMDKDSKQDAKQDILQQSLAARAHLKGKKDQQPLQQQVEKELGAMFKDVEARPDQVRISEEAAAKSKQLVKEQNTQKATAKEEGFIFSTDEEMAGLKAADQERRQQNLKEKQSQKRQMDAKKMADSKTLSAQEQTGILKEYAAAFTGYLQKRDSKNKQQMEITKQRLKEKGVTQKQISHMETHVGQIIQHQYAFDLKKGLMKYFFSKGDGQHQKVQSQFEFHALVDQVQQLKDSGLLKKDFVAMMDNMNAEVRRDVENFVFDEASSLARKMTMGTMDGEEFGKEMTRLQKLSEDSGVRVDQQSLMTKIHKTIEHEGLEAFIPPPGSETINYGEGDARGEDQSNKEDKLYVNQEEQFEDKLRHLYFLQAMNSGLRETIELRFKMRKLRNGLIKLGVYTPEIEEQLSQEASMLAQIKLTEELQEVFREQATLPKLSGPTYTILRKKKEWIVKRLKRLDVWIGAKELQKARDEANADMYPIIREQLKQIEVALEVRQGKALVYQHKMMMGITERLLLETPSVKQSSDDGTTVIIYRDVDEAA